MMDRIKQELENGGAVVLPTETVYGLFAKALDEKAVDHVYQLKRRPRDKALNLQYRHFRGYLAFFKESANLSTKTCRGLFTGSLDHYSRSQ